MMAAQSDRSNLGCKPGWRDDMDVMQVLRLAVAACAWATAADAEPVWPVPDVPIRIMNTLSTLQFYGPTPGFHHGLDLAAPAGTMVVAPISGRVETRYYYKRKSDYTYEVAIIADDGTRWELHHIDPDEIPPAVEELASTGGRITAGEPVGGLYDASEIGIEPHLHINLIRTDGLYMDPLAVFPPIGDHEGPILNAHYWAVERDGALIELMGAADEATDLAPGDMGPLSLEAFSVRSDGRTLFEFDLETLPSASFLEGAGDVYFLRGLELEDGTVLGSDVVEDLHFLYAVPLGETAPGAAIEVVMRDASGNAARRTISRAGP